MDSRLAISRHKGSIADVQAPARGTRPAAQSPLLQAVVRRTLQVLSLGILFFQTSCSSSVPLTQTATVASLAYPEDQAIGIDPYAPFRWNPDPAARKYNLCVGTNAGATDVWCSGDTDGTSVSVPSLWPTTSYYLQLTVKLPNHEYGTVSSTFTSGTGLAHLIDPVDTATDVDPLIQLAWNNVIDAEMYRISLSTILPGGSEAYDSGDLPNIGSLAAKYLQPNTVHYYNKHSLTDPVLQANTKYYARLLTTKGGLASYVDSTFTTGDGTAHLNSPDNSDGRGGVGPTTTFTWSSIPVGGMPQYSIAVGTRPGLRDVWDSGLTNAIEATIPRGRLRSNTTYYVELSTLKHGKWVPADSSFSTGSFQGSFSGAHILYPTDGAVNVDPFAPIVWSGMSKPYQYQLYIGDGHTRGINYRNYVSFLGGGNQTSWAGGLIGGTTYYATLWTTSRDATDGCSDLSPCVYAHAIKFTTTAHPMPHNANSFYSNVVTAISVVRNMAPGEYLSSGYDVPFGSTFLRNNLDPQDYGAACSDFANNLLVQFQNNRIVARRRNLVFGAGPASHTVVEYYDPFLKKWTAADSTFGIWFYDPSRNPSSMSVDDVASALSHGLASSIPYQFATQSSVSPGCPQCCGSYWVQNFATDPILLYLNPIDRETGRTPSNDPNQFLIDTPDSIGVKGVYLFRFANPTDSVVLNNGGVSVTVQPQASPADIQDFGNVSASVSLVQDWSFVGGAPIGMKIERPACPVFTGPNCH